MQILIGAQRQKDFRVLVRLVLRYIQNYGIFISLTEALEVGASSSAGLLNNASPLIKVHLTTIAFQEIKEALNARPPCGHARQCI